MNVTDQTNLNGESQNAYSLGMETQVPEMQFSLSSDDDSIGTQVKKRNCTKIAYDARDYEKRYRKK